MELRGLGIGTTVAGLTLIFVGALLVRTGDQLLREQDLQGFSFEKAQWAAYLSVAAYCGAPKWGSDRAIEAWQCGPACDATRGTIGRVKMLHNADFDDGNPQFAAALVAGPADADDPESVCVLSFRGTFNSYAWMSNIESAAPLGLPSQDINCTRGSHACMAGYGFVKAYLSLRIQVKAALNEFECKNHRIQVTGHSLGAAQALLAMMDLYNDGYLFAPAYTFGQPRIGDRTFDKVFRDRFGDHGVYRITNGRDPVPHLPALSTSIFRHMPTEVYFFSDNDFKVCSGDEDPTCSNKHHISIHPGRMNASAHLRYLTASTGLLMSGESCQVLSQLIA